MDGMIVIAIMVGTWLLLQLVILPRLGFNT
jgi:hypothetical protein